MKNYRITAHEKIFSHGFVEAKNAREARQKAENGFVEFKTDEGYDFEVLKVAAEQ